MEWERQLEAVVESNSLRPTFAQWLEATGYDEYARNIFGGNVNLQATGFASLYDYYEAEMRRRFPGK